MTFGERLAELRKSKGLTMTSIANEIGYTTRGYKRLEDGITGKTLDKLPRLARALGCRIDDLFPEMDDVSETPAPAPHEGAGAGGHLGRDGAELERGEHMDEWISTKDRMPDRDGQYLCCYGFFKDRGFGRRFIGCLDYYATDIKPHFQHESMGLYVTHWMALPEMMPPEVQDD